MDDFYLPGKIPIHPSTLNSNIISLKLVFFGLLQKELFAVLFYI